MAEIDFKRHVPAVGQGETLPKPIDRHVEADVSRIPDIQKAVNDYAADTNWMSSMGSFVATKASNAIAAQIGTGLGKDPKGDIGPSFTEFDTELNKNYAQQAQATLSIQANKLITQSNIDLATQPRISPDMISKTQQSVASGVEKILSLAPNSVRPHMEYQFGSMMINDNEQLIGRMVREQKVDRINNLTLSNSLNNENINKFSVNGIRLDKNGNSTSAESALSMIISQADAALKNYDITPIQHKEMVDTAKITFISGNLTRKAL